MLNQIEDTIKNLPSISFEEFYTNYVDDVEGYILQQETSKIASQIYTAKNVTQIEKSIDILFKGVKEIL